MKKCGKCKLEKAFSEFHKNRRAKGGLKSQCKLCVKQYKQANKERIAEYKKAYREANKEHIAEYHKAWQKANPERKAEYDQAYREANKEREAARVKAWQKANPERVAEYQKAWYQANKERKAELTKARRKANPDKFRAYDQARRALERNALVDKDISVTGLRQIYDDLCFYCLEPLDFITPGAVHVDHIIPLSKGGEHSWDNVCLACSTCNLTKNAKNPLEFLARFRVHLSSYGGYNGSDILLNELRIRVFQFFEFSH